MSQSQLSAQPVDATQALNLSAGVSNVKVLRGRSLSSRATLFRCWTNDHDWGVLLTWEARAATCGIAERRPQRAAAHLTRDEARRIAANIAKLPELLRRSPQLSEA